MFKAIAHIINFLCLKNSDKKLLKKLLIIHEDLVGFGSKVQMASKNKFENERHIKSNVHAVMYKVNAYGTTLHRAIQSLCENGWTQVTPCLLRTIMECSVNCLAIVNNEYPEYMAFKYFYHEYVRIYRNEMTSSPIREKSLRDINSGIENISDSRAKEKAQRYVAESRLDYYWFKPEESSVSQIIECYGSNDVKNLYGILSQSIHAGHLGLFMFTDDPDNINVNPCENPVKTNLAIILSCRLLLELINIRIDYERLEFQSAYVRFIERIFTFENEVRGGGEVSL